MSGQWYIARSGQRVGPFAFEDLKQMATTGLLLPTDMVLEEATQQWRSARDAGGLFEAGATSRPTPAPPSGNPSPTNTTTETPAAEQPAPGSSGTPIYWGGACIGVWWLLQTAGCIPEDVNPFSGSQEKRVAQEIAEANAVIVPAETMARDYEANEIAANGKYKGKVVQISGVITKIQGEGGLFGRRPFLQVGGVTCEFKEEEALQSVSAGQQVTIRGKCKGGKSLSYCQLR